MKKITIKDVAKKLNYSISTISRAFNDKYDIHPATRDEILRAAKEMGYNPNPIAKGLIQNKSFLIGIVVPEFLNSFFPKAILGIQKVMLEEGYQTLIMPSNEDQNQELENFKTLERNMVDGIIVSFSGMTTDITYYKEMVANKIPIVQFNRVNMKLKTPKIVFDDYNYAMIATEHLIESGYKNIYHLSGPNNLIISQNRKRGYIDALKKHNIEYHPDRVIECGININDGMVTAKKIISKGEIPDAIFCFNDPIAVGAIEEFKTSGYAIPQDIGFVGFTESILGQHISPRLTSVEQPVYDIGEAAAKKLLEIMKTKNTEKDETIVFSGKLNIRESSLKK